MKFLLRLACFVLIAFASYSVVATENSAISEAETIQMALGLNAEQLDKLQEALNAIERRRTRILKKYGISMENNRKKRLNNRDKMSLTNDLKKLQVELESNLADILNDEQMSQWRVIQEQAQQAFREQLKKKIG